MGDSNTAPEITSMRSTPATATYDSVSAQLLQRGLDGHRVGEPIIELRTDMPTYQVELRRTVTTTVTVEAEDEEAAVAVVDDPDYQLPAAEMWTALSDWEYVVYNEDGDEELLRRD